MIRPLRRHHRWIMPGLLVLLGIAAALALRYPTPSARLDALPQAVAGGQHNR